MDGGSQWVVNDWVIEEKTGPSYREALLLKRWIYQNRQKIKNQRKEHNNNKQEVLYNITLLQIEFSNFTTEHVQKGWVFIWDAPFSRSLERDSIQCSQKQVYRSKNIHKKTYCKINSKQGLQLISKLMNFQIMSKSLTK